MQKRKVNKDVAAIAKKAKKAMASWISSLSELPSEKEIRAWQAGYIAGINQTYKD
jgi:hypothetical protein